MKNANKRGKKYPFPVPATYQKKARLRRIRQQLRDGVIIRTQAEDSVARLVDDLDLSLRLEP